MTTPDVLDLLEVRKGSEFWNQVADGMAARAVESLAAAGAAGASSLAESGTNASHLAALRRQELRDALSSRGARTAGGPGMQAAQALAGEHWLVQRTVHSALRLEASAAVDLKCAAIVKYHGSPPAEIANEYITEEPDTKSGVGTPAAGDRMQQALTEAWAEVSNRAGEAVALFTQFLRWEVQIAILGTGVPGIPMLGYKCQPLFVCLQKVAQTPLLFLKLIGYFFWYLAKVISTAMEGIGAYLGKPKNSLAQLQPQPQQQDGASTPALLELPMHYQNDPGDAVATFVSRHRGSLFKDMDAASDECAPCAGRLKGLFDVDPLNAAAVVATGGLVGVMKMWITSVPRPVEGAEKSCLSCLSMYREQLTRLLTGSSAMSAEKYFESGQCNPHTLGLCLMLDKIHSCGSSIGDGGQVTTAKNRGEAGKAASDKQKAFCGLLGGVQVSLTQADGRVVCPKMYEEQLEGKKLADADVTKMDMGAGCHLVRDALERYNRKCEAKEKGADKNSGADKNWFARMGEQVTKTITEKTEVVKQHLNLYEYKKDVDPGSLEEAAAKCRALFDCPEPGKAGAEDHGKTRVNWEDLVGDIRGIVSQVDDYAGKPRSYSPTQASKQIVRLLNSVSGTMSKFEGDISKKVAAVKVTSNRWDADLKNIFDLDLWNDKCFDFTKLGKELQNVEAKKGKDPKGAQSFFSQAAKVLKVWTWGDKDWEGQCTALGWDKAERSVTHPSPRTDHEGPVLTAVANIPDVGAFLTNVTAKDGATIEIDCLGIPGGVEVQLVKINGAWYLQRCFLLGQCNGAVPGNRLRTMSLQVVGDEASKGFRQAAGAFVDSMAASETAMLGNIADNDMQQFQVAATILEKAAKDAKLEGTYYPTLINGAFIAALKAVVDKSAALQSFVRQRGWQFRARTAASEKRALNGLPQTKQQCLARYGSKECQKWDIAKALKGSAEGFDLVGADGRELATMRQLRKYIRFFKLPHMDAFISMRDSIRTMGLALLKNVKAVEVWPAPKPPPTLPGSVLAEVVLSFDALDISTKGLKTENIQRIKAVDGETDIPAEEDMNEFDEE